MTEPDDPRDAAQRTLRQLGVVVALFVVNGGFLAWYQADTQRRSDDALRDLQCELARQDGNAIDVLAYCR